MLQRLYLKFPCAKFASNLTNIKQIRKGVPMPPHNPNYFTSKKGQLLQGPYVE